MTTTDRNAMASPLHWPIGRPRTKPGDWKRNSLWKRATVATACLDIENEVRRLGGRDLVVSTNLALRLDGYPRSGQSEPADSGVAVYFDLRGKKIALACDRWTTVAQNLRAIAMHIEAIRGQERWGVGTIDQAFAGYQALPDSSAPAERPWWDVLGFTPLHARDWRLLPVDDRRKLLAAAYRAVAKTVHPDAGGSQERFVELQKAYETAQAELGVA